MKIVLVNRYFDPDQSATSRIVSSLAFALAREGVAVTALASRSLHDGSDAGLPAVEIVDGVQIHRLPTTGFGRARILGRAVDYLTFHAAAAGWLARNVRRGDVCVLCTDPPMLSASGVLPVRLRGGRAANWIMDLFPEAATELGVLPRGAASRLAIAVRDWSLKRADLTLCPIQAMSDHLADRLGPASRIATVHHWTDDAQIRPVDPADNRLRREWGLRESFVVGYSGNFGRAHEFSTLLAAADALRSDDGIRFLMVGAGQQKAAVERGALQLGLPNLQFRPFQPADRLAESLGAADVHLVSLRPSLEHCIVPSKLYGILAAGRPAIFIGDPVGEVATVLRTGGCGSSVAPGDVEGLVRSIRALRDDPDTCRQQGANALAILRERFSLDAGVARWKRAVAAIATEEPALTAPIRDFAT
jgi:colanic acid biosynthesis glycosyl transferase WcaI